MEPGDGMLQPSFKAPHTQSAILYIYKLLLDSCLEREELLETAECHILDA